MINASSRIMIVAAGALLDPNGRVLLQRRPLGDPLEGLWEFPGGKAEAGETPEQALVRELREELGIELDAANLSPAGFATASLDDRHLVLLLFLARRWRGQPHPIEADAIDWVHPAAMRALAIPPPDYPLAEQLAALLTGRSEIS